MWPRSCDLFVLNFGTLSISVEQLRLQTSNLVFGLTTNSLYKRANYGTKGSWPRSRHLLLNFWNTLAPRKSFDILALYKLDYYYYNYYLWNG